MSYSLVNSESFGNNNWCLNLQPAYQHSLLASLSNGQVHQLDWQTGKSIAHIKTGEVAVNKLKLINNDHENESTYATATMGAVKIWDIRSNNCLATISNDKNAPFLSLDSRHNMLACGTELSGSDAELHIYDVRKWDSPLRSLVDSHHDDITDIAFHPSDPNVLMSGSTDGYTNIYDLRQAEEEDALHQVINFASIHSCGWLAPRRIFTLSHMETFSIHELNDKSDEAKEPRPVEFNDVRESWGCDYVVDIHPGYVACGNSQEGIGKLRILPFQGEQVDTNNAIDINAAHGDEVVRDVFVPARNSKLLYSCGEDGSVKTWENKSGPLNVTDEFWDYSQLLNVLDEQPVVVEEPKETKHSKKKHSKSKKSNKQRFKPY
ncbi:hypothetical protein ZYGR_0A00840 [Zygosaccharomyces rouxii]|uniref:ZYRO0A01804p n=2 Tax=Zygosaccharomyces rouxii TaxID=4956 RepID=C5DPA9_ZYGRC|nr:uncharacterized protein ZYRO0A01804g [Zygosaccharomyces rouxii]KAH9198960.1 WD40-repeat-containing domain protein [Zygosaccharomyces rouxii]GAV46492.1 hypothetical protein ZYGR_0A00840 [Zygosaccharomyces rouxii]CAR25520.1 ZYRO0A01804p [Zygosaccharomyces rouxii]